ncbi:FAD-binding oxidoreductase [Paraoerskovia sediminicola]|nr:FAD-binding oxidoreductase [Paraoerskovia sediminicola]
MPVSLAATPVPVGLDVLRRPDSSRPGDVAVDGPEGVYERRRRALSASGVVPATRPWALVRVRTPADVAEALGWARRCGRPVSVRSGGHSLSFTAFREGAVVLDLSGLDSIEVDRGTRTARVGAGVTSLALAQALHTEGLAFPVGHKATVGLGGFLLAGGNGWNQGVWGSAAESIRAADVVLPGGPAGSAVAGPGTHRIDRTTDPEAFAALRGAGPGFPGVVTAFELHLRPRPAVVRSVAVFDGRDVAEACAWADRLRESVPPEIELTVYLAPRGGQHAHLTDGSTVTVSATAFCASPAAAETLARQVLRGAPESALRIDRAPTDIPSMLDAQTLPPGLGMAAQQAWTDTSYSTVVPPLLATVGAAPSAHNSVLVSSASYRRAEPPARDMAYLPLGTITVAAYAAWAPGQDDEANRAWPGQVLDAVRPWWAGHYVGELDLRRTPELLPSCFRPGVLDSIAAVRARLDPDGLVAGPLETRADRSVAGSAGQPLGVTEGPPHPQAS